MIAVTALLLVQHGVRHLLLADDRHGIGLNQSPPLLDAYHPFPSLPPQQKHANVFDPTPVSTTLSVAAGQIVAIGSLDRSIRLHQIQLTAQPKTVAANQPANSDQMWFDVGEADTRPTPSKLNQTSNHQGQTNQASGHPSQTAALAANDLPLPNLQPARRFQLPFFRNGKVYERTLIRQLIQQNQLVTVYGDPSNELHQQAANDLLDASSASLLNFVTQTIGPINDLDGDGRLALVLGQLADPIASDPIATESISTEQSSVKSNPEPIRGCVRPADFQSGRPSSVDVIYLDPNHLTVDHLQSLLAHEFAHAAAFSLLVNSNQTPTAMPGWLNEAVAHHVEYQIAPQSENLLQRRRLFEAKPWQYPSVIPDEFTGIELRRGPSRIASLELLLSSINHHANMNLKTLITSQGNGIDRLQTASQSDFPSLFRMFARRLAERQIMITANDNAFSVAQPRPPAAFTLAVSTSQSIQLRGTAVAISSPAERDCVLVIQTNRDAIPQITLINPLRSSSSR